MNCVARGKTTRRATLGATRSPLHMVWWPRATRPNWRVLEFRAALIEIAVGPRRLLWSAALLEVSVLPTLRCG